MLEVCWGASRSGWGQGGDGGGGVGGDGRGWVGVVRNEERSHLQKTNVAVWQGPKKKVGGLLGSEQEWGIVGAG